MMRPRTLLVAAFAATVLAGCSQSQVVVSAEIEVPDPENEGQMMTSTLSDLEIRLYPFDRDAVFDSLTAAASSPEPPIPDSLAAARDEVQRLQGEWQAARTQWQTIRDRLNEINGELEGMSRTDARYVTLFNEFQSVERNLGGAERAMNASFEDFDALQQAVIDQSEQISIQRNNWADDAFAAVGDVFNAKVAAAGRDILYDTTGAQGSTELIQLPAGTWWINARHELPFDELYWNIMVEVEGSEPIVIRLDRSNAVIRPNL